VTSRVVGELWDPMRLRWLSCPLRSQRGQVARSENRVLNSYRATGSRCPTTQIHCFVHPTQVSHPYGCIPPRYHPRPARTSAIFLTASVGGRASPRASPTRRTYRDLSSIQRYTATRPYPCLTPSPAFIRLQRATDNGGESSAHAAFSGTNGRGRTADGRGLIYYPVSSRGELEPTPGVPI
jgi:hypothetical protein